MRFIQMARKAQIGFRVSDDQTRQISSVCGEAGTVIVDLIHADTGQKHEAVKAIWSSGRVRVVEKPEGFDENAEYLITVKRVTKRNKGERV